MTGLRVVIADDHPPTRAGIRASLESDGFEVVSEVGEGEGAVTAAFEHRPDICLLDIRMPGGGGIEAARRIAALPDTTVVMLTVSQDDDDLFESLRAGARGYLLKDTDPNRLPAALRGVLEGEAALPRTLVMRVIEEFGSRPRRQVPKRGGLGHDLTEREWEVLALMRDGHPTSEIAQRLFVSPVTVRSHVSAILRKLNVADRVSALRLLEEQDELNQ